MYIQYDKATLTFGEQKVDFNRVVKHMSLQLDNAFIILYVPHVARTATTLRCTISLHHSLSDSKLSLESGLLKNGP